MRERLPATHESITHKFQVGGLEGYITVGLYEDGRPGEVFLTAAKGGSMIRGSLDAFAIMLSIALQHGVNIDDIVRKLRGVTFEPQGFTANTEIPNATSVIDYVARWLEKRFVLNGHSNYTSYQHQYKAAFSGDGCPECGGMLVMQEGCQMCVGGCGFSKC